MEEWQEVTSEDDDPHWTLTHRMEVFDGWLYRVITGGRSGRRAVALQWVPKQKIRVKVKRVPPAGLRDRRSQS